MALTADHAAGDIGHIDDHNAIDEALANLPSTVTGYRLDEFAKPTAYVEINGQKLTTVADPSANSGDAANSRYVDSGSAYVVRTSGNQSIGGDKHFTGATTCDKFHRGSGATAGTNFAGQYRSSSGASISHISWTNLPFNAVAQTIHDDTSSLVTVPDFHLPITGMWMLSACITLPASSCYWAIQWFCNPDIVSQESRPSFGNDTINLTTCSYFSSGDIVTLRIYQDSAGSLTVPAHSSTTPCWATATLLA